MKKLLTRITAATLAALMLTGTVLSSASFAYDGYSAEKRLADINRAKVDATWSATAESQAIDNGYHMTGLSSEMTYTTDKPHSIPSYNKLWAGTYKGSPKSFTMQTNGSKLNINVNCSDMVHEWATCMAGHVDGMVGEYYVGNQFVCTDVYWPTNNINDYPEDIKNSYSADEAKFYLLLYNLLITQHISSESALKDTHEDTEYSILAFATARAFQMHTLTGGCKAGTNAQAAWNQLTLIPGWASTYNPDQWGGTSVWSAINTTAKSYFIDCWNKAAVLAAFDYSTTTPMLPLSPAVNNGGLFQRIMDYSLMSDATKQGLASLTYSGVPSGVTITNNGSQIIFTGPSADALSDSRLAAMTISYGSGNIAPRYLIGVKITTYLSDSSFGFVGQTRYLGTAAKLEAKAGPGGGGFPPTPTPLVEGEYHIDRYCAQEEFVSTYNIDLYKYDSETGKGLEGAEYKITHTADDDLVDDDNWLENEISDECESGGDGVTDESGHLRYTGDAENGHTDVHKWQYKKGYCGGHPSADSFYPDEPDADDEDAHDAWEEECEKIDQQYDDELMKCQELAAAGGYFCCGAADEDGSQAKEEITKDRNRVYNDFISITYTYSIEEIKAPKGYLLHGVHPDDIDIETRTVYSSEYKDGNLQSAVAEPVKGKRFNIITASDVSTFEKMFGVMEVYAAETDDAKPVAEDIEKRDEVLADKTEEVLTDKTEEVVQEDTPSSENKDEHTAETVLTENDSAPSIVPEQENQDNAEVQQASLSEPDTLSSDSLNVDDTEIEEATLSEIGASEEEISVWKEISEFLSELWQNFRNSLGRVGKKVMKLAKAPLKTLLSSSGGGSTAESLYANWISQDIDKVPDCDHDITAHTWSIYDHRTEGEIHISKKDLDLAEKESADYDSYADSNGDGTLEGAVYGLFAAQAIEHPDKHTGTVYEKDNLVAIATTDRDGNASFTAFTEAPGYTWSYEDGTVKKQGSFTGPTNLHSFSTRDNGAVNGKNNYTGHDDGGGALTFSPYASGDSTYYNKKSSNQSGLEITGNKKTYPILNNKDNNGNEWIGRPLIVGKEDTAAYYVRELTRAEGYELSIYGKDGIYTNGPGSYDRAETTGTLTQLSKKTEFSIAENPQAIPYALAVTYKGTDLSGTITFEVPGITADMAAAISSTEEVAGPTRIEAIGRNVQKKIPAEPGAFVQILQPGKADMRVEASSVGETKSYTVSGTTYSHTVRALSAPEKQTVTTAPASGTKAYVKDLSAIYTPSGLMDLDSYITAFNTELADKGYKEPAEGAPWVWVNITGFNDTVWTSQILSAMQEKGLEYCSKIKVMPLSPSHPDYVCIQYEYDNTMTTCKDYYDPVTKKLYIRKNTGRSASDGYPEFIYIPYRESDPEVFTWNATSISGTTYVESATVQAQDVSVSGRYPNEISYSLTDASDKTYWVYATGDYEVNTDGSFHLQEVTEKIDSSDPRWGDPAYKDILWKYYDSKILIENVTPLAVGYDSGNAYIQVPASMFDAATDNTIKIKIYSTGASFEPTEDLTLIEKKAGATDSYIVFAGLDYPGENTIIQATDSYSGLNTIINPLPVYERPIRQKVKLFKDITLDADMNSDGTGDAYRNNTFDLSTEKKLTNFRFKIYLKSNLERLYRDAAGNITWLDRNGNEMVPVYNADGSVSFKYTSACVAERTPSPYI